MDFDGFYYKNDLEVATENWQIVPLRDCLYAFTIIDGYQSFSLKLKNKLSKINTPTKVEEKVEEKKEETKPSPTTPTIQQYPVIVYDLDAKGATKIKAYDNLLNLRKTHERKTPYVFYKSSEATQFIMPEEEENFLVESLMDVSKKIFIGAKNDQAISISSKAVVLLNCKNCKKKWKFRLDQTLCQPDSTLALIRRAIEKNADPKSDFCDYRFVDSDDFNCNKSEEAYTPIQDFLKTETGKYLCTITC